MAKQADVAKKVVRASFSGDGADEVMTLAYPAFGKTLAVPIGKLFDKYGRHGFRHGFKQRFADFRALDKDMSEREKDAEAYERASTYCEHLLNGGDWKMTPERGLTGELVEAVQRVLGGKYSADQIRRAAEVEPKQVSTWRADLKVKHELAKIRLTKASKAAKESDAVLEVNGI